MDEVCIFSSCRLYRYTLWRDWSKDMLFGPVMDGYVMWIGLNPSTADERKDDPTIRKCIGFSKRLGYGRMVMTNLFAFRSTDPRKMKKWPKPIGDDNDRWLSECAGGAQRIIAAWGNHGRFLGRDLEVVKLIYGLESLRLTGDGCPEHPLYVPYSVMPESYPPRQGIP
jgi:hypothetical protein